VGRVAGRWWRVTGRGDAVTAKVALVTGAAGEIGRALLAGLAEAGWRTVATDLAVPDEPPAADLWCAADVTVGGAMDDVVATAVSLLGRIDLVVVNAGITALGTFDDTSDDAFRRVMDVNLHGAVGTLRAALPELRRRRGRVVVLSSVAGFAPVVGRPAYVASKHAVTGLFASLRPELARDGVGVTLVHPTFLATTPAEVAAAGGGAAGRSTTGGTVTADDVARAVVAAVDRGRDRVLVGRTATLAWWVHRLAPGLYERLMVRRLRS
jgi:NAD(P)-dependent dehydrogenase (short-subunit alcohol dehydrogenase family)